MKTLRHASPRTVTWHHRGTAHQVSQVFGAGLETPGRARALVRSALAEAQLGDLTDDACLVVSELAGNAARQRVGDGSPVVLIRLRPTHRSVLIEVGDHSLQPPPRASCRQPDASACDGRGLPIVLSLSARAGWYRRNGWKVVWARVRVPQTGWKAPLLGRAAAFAAEYARAAARRPKRALSPAWASFLFRDLRDDSHGPPPANPAIASHAVQCPRRSVEPVGSAFRGGRT
jgi:hypothetical protein